MRILQIIDSLELNGGSTMFLETVRAMRRYWPDDDIVPYVVSKSGKYGRDPLISETLPQSYGVEDIQVYNYKSFQEVAAQESDSVVFHHVLGHTKPIRFNNTCRYIVVNHTMTNVVRLCKFHPYRLVSVCQYFADRTKSKTKLHSTVILNKIEDHFQPRDPNTDTFIIGRCQRVVPSKFSKVKIDKSIFPQGYQQIVVGPIHSGKSSKQKDKRFFGSHDVSKGPIFDMAVKIDLVRGFDVYLHSAPSAEGASMAVLEALSCGVPVLASRVGGGISELVREGVNGHFFKGDKNLNKILSRLQKKDVLSSLRDSVRKDFLARLHIKHSLSRYRDIVDGNA